VPRCGRHPRQTIEAQVADKLETLLQAVEYEAQGHDTTACQCPYHGHHGCAQPLLTSAVIAWRG
jgi:hypothetical protein